VLFYSLQSNIASILVRISLSRKFQAILGMSFDLCVSSDLAPKSEVELLPAIKLNAIAVSLKTLFCVGLIYKTCLSVFYQKCWV